MLGRAHEPAGSYFVNSLVGYALFSLRPSAEWSGVSKRLKKFNLPLKEKITNHLSSRIVKPINLQRRLI